MHWPLQTLTRILILSGLVAPLRPLPAPALDSAVPDLRKLPPASAAPVDFTRDIEPLFARHCVKCHGPEKQKGGLRLDHRTSAFQGGDDGKVIVAGESGASRLIHLIGGLEPDSIMPPKEEPLPSREIAMLRAWIDQGAPWPDDGKAAPPRSDHWSLQPLTDPAVPDNFPDAITAFIGSRLARDGLSPAAPADRLTLIRRLNFDLIGLPPSPGEIDAFIADPSPRAYENLVDRLLASPQYGERWGRHWLDVARYTESDGFEYDRLRGNAWHYRDYVINSFNSDKPYDRFMKEQVAGDVLEPVTAEGIIAASLLVCGPWDAAGNAQANATQRAITREDELEDILGVVGQSFLGLTINCARCHAHKFDPIPHAEYYRLKSVFEGVKHGERSLAGTAEQKLVQTRTAALEAEIAQAVRTVSDLESAAARVAAAKRPRPIAAPGPAAWLRWSFDSQSAAPDGTLYGGAAIASGSLQLPSTESFFQSAPLPRDLHEKTLEAWVSLANLDQGGGAAISVETGDGRVFDALVFGEREPRRWMAGSNAYARTRDLGIPDETAGPEALIHVAAVYRADHSIALFRNGEPLGQPYTPDSPLQTFAAGKAQVLLGKRHTGGGRAGLMGAIRHAAVYDRALSDAEIADSFRAGGTTISWQEIAACLSPGQVVEREAALAVQQRARASLEALRQTKPSLSYAGTRVQPQPTKRLIRGEVNSPDEVVTPGALSAIYPLNPDFGLAADAPEAQRRLKFAEWLTDPRHPLPARVMVNRIWHLHFGQGIVATPNDFGIGGTRPSHPELLDWLALRFIEGGWSVKALHRLIVHSAVYRQSPEFNAKAAGVDADNQLLWRFPPRRLEAEAVRDAMLAVSGQLNPAPGGPGFRPFTITEFNAAFYQPVDRAGPEFNRRTVYRANVNSGKDPLLDAFDCPDPSVKTPRRGVTITPLQALELMNHPFVQRQAEHLAERALTAAGSDASAVIPAAWRLALGRAPRPDEVQGAAKAMETRGLVSVCWALLNSTEFVYVR